MKTKKQIIEKDSNRKFQFDESFKQTFDTVIDIYAKTLNELNNVSTGKKIKSEFGVCNCSYKMRFITPENVSEYVSNLIKGIESGLFEHRSTDIEIFSVASVKKFIESNGGDVFESSSVLSGSRDYVNPKEYTLNDLLLISENDIGNVSVYSKGELVTRIELAREDIDKINKTHFTATIKNIVRSMSDVIEKSNSYMCNSPAMMEIFRVHLEEFILFACSLNTITVLQLIGYCDPSVEYTPVDKGGGTQGVITECCLCNTNDFMIRNFIPFNCNMRDVVLQDVTPNFRDVHDALHFIMRNYRSPICGLVNKFATKEANVGMDCGTISRLFSGFREYHHDDDIFKHYGERVIGGLKPMDIAGFETSVTWLDNIAFGNNYIDGNYRRDANGNATVHPILNSLDMMYKIFNGVELKTNEDLANNVVRVACLMRGIIHDYNDEQPVPNYQLVKDILVVLGEIFTRNMLKLYYNNTRVFTYSDDMPDTMDPGFICMESFIMEADAEKTPTGQQSTAAPKVSFTGQNQQELAQSAKTKASMLMQHFIEWIRTKIMKYSDNFNKNHKQEIEWINGNMKLNQDIQTAIEKKTFTPNVTNMPRFKINAAFLSKIKMAPEFEKLINSKDELKINDFIIDVISGGISDLKTALHNASSDARKQTDIFTNYILYDSIDVPNGYTGALKAKGGQKDTEPSWEALYTDLINTPKVLDNCRNISADLDKIMTNIKQKTAELESRKSTGGTNGGTGNAATVNGVDIDAQIKRLDEINKGIKDVLTKTYIVPVLNAITLKFFKTNYNLYRDIVAGYKQQSADAKQSAESGGNDALKTPDANSNGTQSKEVT